MSYTRATGVAVAALAAGLVGMSVGATRAVRAPTTVTVQTDVRYGTADGEALLLDAYLPVAGDGPRPAVVLVHGGAWRAGDKGDFEVEARRLAGRGWAAFSVNYRLDSSPAFPAEVDDVQRAVRWVRAHAAEYAVDPGRIGALGASAGGHLVAMLATAGDGPLDEGARVRVAASWSGPMDLTRLATAVPELTGGLLGCLPQACPDQWSAASPVNHVDPSDAPLLLVNSADELVPLDQAEVMAERLQGSGVEHRLEVLPGGRHAPRFRNEVWDSTVAFLRAALEPPQVVATDAPGTVGIAPGSPTGADGSSGASRWWWVPVASGVVVGLVVARLMLVVNRGRRRRDAGAPTPDA